MNQDQLTAALAASPSPDRITPEYLASRIATKEFHRLPGGTMTVCTLTLDNGFQVIGESACADPANYRQDVGEKIAFDVAERKIWPLLGFMLREAMWLRDRNGQSDTWEGFKSFRCHKVVEAAVIRAAEFCVDGSGKVAIRGRGGETETIHVSAGFLRTPGTLNAGDILVRYSPDGYLSWSPRDVFLDGYRPL